MSKRDEKGQFIPGESGNPAGRPPFSIVSILKELVQEVPEGEKEPLIRIKAAEYLEKMDAIAFRDMVDRFDGKAVQHVEMHNDKDAEWQKLFKNIDDKIIAKANGDTNGGQETESKDSDS